MTITASMHLNPYEELPENLPRLVVETTIATAQASPCQKSHRGSVVFGVDYFPAAHGHPAENLINIYGAGFNGQPPPWRCDGTCARRLIDKELERRLPPALRLSVCSLMCRHAEQRAITAALTTRGLENLALDGLDIVHIKVDQQGRACASDRPSCWQCSAAILDAKLAGVWLYEKVPESPEVWEVVNAFIAAHKMAPAWPAHWRRYTAEDFHARTLCNTGIVRKSEPGETTKDLP